MENQSIYLMYLKKSEVISWRIFIYFYFQRLCKMKVITEKCILLANIAKFAKDFETSRYVS